LSEKPIYILNASAIIALQRKGKLTQYIKDKTCLITSRVKEELIEKPKLKLREIKTDELRKIVEGSVKEIEIFVSEGKLVVALIKYKRFSKLLDEARKAIAIYESRAEHEVKADHTIVVLALQKALEGRKTILVSNDKTINKVVQKLATSKGVKITIKTTNGNIT